MNINKLTNYTAGVAQIWMDKGPVWVDLELLKEY